MKGHAYRLGYRADLEGLRAIAILLVVAAHASVPGLAGGFVGVDVFFVLSGFLITGLIVKDESETGRFGFVEFYLRRLRRLLPALLLMVFVVAVTASFLIAPVAQQGQATAAATAVLWLSNIQFALANLDYFAPNAKTNLFLHTWSLGVEEQFYLIWPALLVGLLRPSDGRSRTRLKQGLLIVAVASLAGCIYLTYLAPRMAFYMMPLRAWQFAAGALVWLCFNTPNPDGQRVHSRVLKAAGWCGMALIIISALWLDEALPYPGVYALVPTLGAMGVVAAGCTSATNGSVSRLLSWRPLQWLGNVSYSWYLWHWPVLLLGVALIGVAGGMASVIFVVLSLLLATISYYLVETPVRNQKLCLARPRMALLGALACMVLANSLCLKWHTAANKALESPGQQRFVKAHSDAPIIYAMGCDEWYHSARLRICAFGAKQAEHTAILLGDSHAGQWFPAVANVFDRPNWRLLVMTKSSCPMVDESFFYARIGKVYSVCEEWRKNALAEIANIKPDVVLFSTALVQFDKSQWIEGTSRVLAKIGPSSKHIFIIRDTPHLPFDGPHCLASRVERPGWINEWSSPCEAPIVDQYASEVYGWLKQAAERYPNVRTIDLNSEICPDGRCKALHERGVVFRDSQHLTGSFAATLGSRLAANLRLPNLAAIQDSRLSDGISEAARRSGKDQGKQNP